MDRKLIDQYRKKFDSGPPVWGYPDALANELMQEAIKTGKLMVGSEEYYDLPKDAKT